MTTQAKTTTDTDYYVTYELRGVTYLPHYNKPCYVGPNYSAFEGLYDRDGDKCYFTDKSREYSEELLISLGAKKVVQSLWKRPSHKAIKQY